MSLHEKAAGLKRDKEQESKNDALRARYIFDPAKVQRKVPFAMFRSPDVIGVGVFLPAWHEITAGKEKAIIGREQRDVAVIITSNRELCELFYGQVREHNIRVESVPGDLELRWSLPSIAAHIQGTAPTINAREVFQRIKAAYQEFLYFGMPSWYTVHALWDIGTYFHQLFSAYPFLELRGVKGSAKSKVMDLSSAVSFNSTGRLANPTESTLFRTTHDKRPTTYIDEAENLFRVVRGAIEYDARVEVLNMGYSRGGAVPRMESIGKRWVQFVYQCYSPKMIASINGLQGATETRAIIHIMVRAPNNDARGENEIKPNDTRWSEIRDELYLLLMQQWGAIENSYFSLERDNPTTLKKREWQLWRPILAIARVVGEDVFQEVIQHAEKLSTVRTEEVPEGSFDHVLLTCVRDLIDKEPVVLLKQIAGAAVWGEKKPNSKTIRRKLDGFGFAEDFAGHTREGAAYRITRERFNSILATIAPDIICVTPSLPSQNIQFIEDTVINNNDNDVTKRDGSDKSVTEIGDGNDASDGNEGNPEPTTTITRLEDVPAVLRILGEATPEELAARCTCKEPLRMIEKALEQYKKQGDIFEPRAGRWRVLE